MSDQCRPSKRMTANSVEHLPQVVVLWAAVVLLFNPFSSSAEVGMRKKIQGKKQAAAPSAPTPPAMCIGSVRLSIANSTRWKSEPVESLIGKLPTKPSLYVIGNFADTNTKLKEVIEKLGANTKVVDETSNWITVFSDRDNAEELTKLRGQNLVDVVEAISPRQKLTLELQSHLARLAAEHPKKATPTLNEKGPESVSPLKVVPEGTTPQLAGVGGNDVGTPLVDDPLVDVNFYLFTSQSDERVRQEIKNAGGATIAAGRDATINVVRARVPASKIEGIAGDASVREGTLNPKFIKHNDVAQEILVRKPPVFVPTIHGEGQIVGHSDSGIDVGKNDTTLHPAFAERILKTFALGRAAANDWSDRGGHGTHTAASIVGTAKFSGIAPKAKLVHQSLDDDSGELTGIPTPLGSLFQQAYDEGARIHSNSWGVSAIDSFGNNANGGSYLFGEEVDRWVWNNGSPRDMLIVISAGNDGNFSVDHGRMTVTAPGTAKNCLTIGASETVRTGVGTNGDNQNDLADFSSKGPTRENRLKPDLVGPGTWIVSAKTQAEKIIWSQDDEIATTNPASASSWSVTPGFSQLNNPPGGALSGTRVWRFNRPVAIAFQDRLITPTIAIPTGHELTLELWVRGNFTEIDRFQIGYQNADGAFVFNDRGHRKFDKWTVISTSVPRALLGTDVRFMVVAQETTGLTAPATFYVDCIKLTTFSSWDYLSSVGFAAANDATDRQYTFSGGTSMATPLAAGCAALVRQSLNDSGIPKPSAELVKAIMINSADPHQGARPNFISGWGLINLKRAIEGNYDFDFETTLANTDVDYSYDFTIAAGVKELRVTLVWADPAAATLTHDLDLTLQPPAGAAMTATAADGSSPDRTNNVEGIDVPNPTAGAWSVKVVPKKISEGFAQPFALVISQIE